MIIKKGATLQNIFLIAILGIAFTVAMLYWVTWNAEQASVDVDDRYNETLTKLIDYQDENELRINEIRNSLDNVQEAQNPLAFAYYGMTGVFAVIRAPLSFLSTAVNTLQAGSELVDFVPTYIKVALTLSIIAIIIFAVVAIYLGRGGASGV